MKIVKRREGGVSESVDRTVSPSRNLLARKGTLVGSSTGEVAASSASRKRPKHQGESELGSLRQQLSELQGKVGSLSNEKRRLAEK